MPRRLGIALKPASPFAHESHRTLAPRLPCRAAVEVLSAHKTYPNGTQSRCCRWT
jgi:hypothetical protein